MHVVSGEGHGRPGGANRVAPRAATDRGKRTRLLTHSLTTPIAPDAGNPLATQQTSFPLNCRLWYAQLPLERSPPLLPLACCTSHLVAGCRHVLNIFLVHQQLLAAARCKDQVALLHALQAGKEAGRGRGLRVGRGQRDRTCATATCIRQRRPGPLCLIAHTASPTACTALTTQPGPAPVRNHPAPPHPPHTNTPS